MMAPLIIKDCPTLKMALPLLLLTWTTPSSADIERPACGDLTTWAYTFVPPAKRAGPDSIPEVFQAEAFAEMFGKPVAQWNDRDFDALDQHMKECQRQLFKQNRQAAKQINTVRRHVPAVEREVEEARALKAEPSAEPPQTAQEQPQPSRRPAARQRSEVIESPAQPHRRARSEPEPAEAQVAESGEAAEAERDRERQAVLAERVAREYESLQGYEFAQLDDLGNYLRKVQSLGRVLADERNSEAAAASGVAKADVKALYENNFLPAVERMHPQFEEYLAGLPPTKAGLTQAKRAVARATGVRYANDVMADYIASAEQRAGAIQAAVDRDEAAQHHAREHMDVSGRLDALFQGSGVGRARLGKVAPGMSTEEAIQLAGDLWGYRKTPNMDMDLVLAPPREVLQGFKAQRRDGGRLTLREMGDRVGQLEFFEQYQAKMELDSVRRQLVDKYGAPDSEQRIDHGVVWSWTTRDRRLEVEVKNQADVIMHAAGFRSRLGMALWNEDYEDYLEEASERCHEIRRKPRSERSMDDASFFMKHHCPVVSDSRLEPGLPG